MRILLMLLSAPGVMNLACALIAATGCRCEIEYCALPQLARLYLARVRYHVYYQVLGEKIVVLAF